MSAATARAVAVMAIVGVLAGACGATVSPEPASPSPPAPTPTSVPSPSPTPQPLLFPLAVAANFTDLRETISPDELASGVKSGSILVPCAVDEVELGDQTLTLPGRGGCLDPAAVVGQLRQAPGPLGLLPVGAIGPAVKVLRVGDADLFGSPSRRAEPYPLVGLSRSIDPALVAYDREDVRTAVSPLNWCPDRGVAQQTITLGKGWDWALDGGTARYTGTHMDRSFSGPDGNGWPVVDAVAVGDRGRVRALIQDADLTIADFRCPMISDFHPAVGSSTVFSIDPRVATVMASVGVDVVGLASNHIWDQGLKGLRQTIQYLDAAGIPHTGAGLNLAQALKPVVIDVRGLRFGFVSFDATIGAPRAGTSTPGDGDLNGANLRTAITAATAEADLVIALPVWNWPEYTAAFRKTSLAQRDEMFDLGVVAVLGDGTHWAAGLSLGDGPDGPRLAVASHGNFLFDQAWSRQTMEGVIYELAFYGRRLAQVRLHPYVILSHAQPNLIDPQTDGAYVLKQVFDASTFALP